MEKFKAIRTEIKKLSEEQRIAKNLRKPNSGVEQWKAQMNVWNNKNHLRHLFQAYAILKGKERPYIWKHFTSFSESKVQELVKQYTPLDVI